MEMHQYGIGPASFTFILKIKLWRFSPESSSCFCLFWQSMPACAP